MQEDPRRTCSIFFLLSARVEKMDKQHSRLQQKVVESDSTIRLAPYQEAEQRIIDNTSCLPLWFSQNYALIKPYVKGYVISPLGIPLLSNVSLKLN